MSDKLSSITFYLENDEVFCKVDLEQTLNNKEDIDLSKRIGDFLALLSLGSLSPVVTHGIAEYGVLSNRKRLTEMILIIWEQSLKTLSGNKEKKEKPVISPTEAFLVKEK